ncbi:VENN motif pre-toxin domain-containing protein [Pantoea ananatis]|nr:VENN motif pre-toxin domain-containing protein [Pantoea ananatis]UYL03533.1 VENN motif pre-toxin domain-containing protein [Pantoea ananatis]
MIGEIGSQVGDIVKTQGAIEATRAANNDMKQVSPEKLQQAQKDWEEANPGKTPTSEQISKQAWQSYYDKALSASPYAVGGSVQRIVTAATAAVQGLASGDIRAAAAGGAAPYIANLIGHSDLDPASRLMAHAVVNAALAAAQDKNIAAGAAGAVTGELTGMLASEIYGKKPYEMNDREKETVSALATLAAGLSGGLAGSGAADMVTAAQTGKVTVENNNLSAVVRLGATACAEVASCRNMVVEKGLGALLGIGVAKTAMDNLSEADRTVILAAAITGKADEIERLTPEQLAAYKEMVEGQKGTLLPLPALDRPLVDSVLTNPTPEQNRGTTLTTPDQRDQNGSSHTGNTSGVPDTGGNTTVTPIAEQNKDELAYLAGGYEPNKGAVGNMGEFFKQPGFGSVAKDGSQKTSKIYQGQSVYKASGNLSNEIRKGDQFYLDASHMNHLEVFDSKGNFRVVLNLDGSINPAKTKVAAAEGRKLPK